MKTRKIFYINLGIAIILTVVGPLYFLLGPMIMFESSLSKVLRLAVQNEAMMFCWVVYIVTVTLLPFTFILPKIKSNP